MDIILLLISILFIILAISRLINIKKPFFIFTQLKKKKAITARIISALIMLVLAYGLIFQYYWAFWLFILDFIIGLINHILLLKKSKIINLLLIIFWILIAGYISFKFS